MKLRSPARQFFSLRRKPSTCEACGEPFTCGAGLSGCWCAEIKLSESVRAKLRARYRNCLCRPCLERFAEGDKNGGTQEPHTMEGSSQPSRSDLDGGFRACVVTEDSEQ